MLSNLESRKMPSNLTQMELRKIIRGAYYLIRSLNKSISEQNYGILKFSKAKFQSTLEKRLF